MASTERKAPRRRGEARALIVASARELFARDGYESTSIRDIAKHAQVADALVYKDFGTKDSLFDETILQPFHEFLESFMAQWRSRKSPFTNEAAVRRFVTELHDLLHDHRELVMALVAANRYASPTIMVDAGGSALSKELDALAALFDEEAEARGMPGTDFFVLIRCATGMIMSIVLLDDWLFPQGRGHPSRTRVIDQITKMILTGVTGPATTALTELPAVAAHPPGGTKSAE